LEQTQQPIGILFVTSSKDCLSYEHAIASFSTDSEGGPSPTQEKSPKIKRTTGVSNKNIRVIGILRLAKIRCCQKTK
jgi:hypothetical protein